MTMQSPLRLRTWLLLAVAISPASAQPAPYAGYVYPAGGQQGTTFQATLGGHDLRATSALCSGTGVRITVVKQERQVTPDEQASMRADLSKIQEKRQSAEVTPEENEIAADLKQQLVQFGRRLSNPSLGEFLTLEIAIAADAPTGDREIRILTPSGLSNPIVFHIGKLPESSKPPWKNVPKSKLEMDPEINQKPPIKSVKLPIVINGQIPPGGADRYQFHALKNQPWLISVRARDLIPYISDAVPGWFQAAVKLTDSSGHELPFTNDFPFRPDPVCLFTPPATDDYTLEIKDSLYRGREDFVYRITICQQPLPTCSFPLTPKNQNLLDDRHTKNLDDLTEIYEREPNNSITTAQPITIPCIINGHIDPPTDSDLFRIECKAGQPIVAEVIARRLDSPLDSKLSITDASGNQLAFNDDHEDPGTGLNTHHADSYITFTPPSTGIYQVHLGDTQQAGSPSHAYRLRISAPRPDFELRITPSSVNIRGNASTPLTAHALRKDGFNGPITLQWTHAPNGFSLSGAEIPAGQDHIHFTLNASLASSIEPFALDLQGSATINGHQVRHPAVPADDMTQAFSYHHLVPAQTLNVAVVGRFRPATSAHLITPTPVKIPIGGTSELEVSMPVGPLINQIHYELLDPPDGIQLKTTSPSHIALFADPAKSKLGTRGNLIILAFATPDSTENTQALANTRRITLGALPAIPYEIAPASQ